MSLSRCRVILTRCNLVMPGSDQYQHSGHVMLESEKCQLSECNDAGLRQRKEGALLAFTSLCGVRDHMGLITFFALVGARLNQPTHNRRVVSQSVS